jgi:hypothetical protein
VLGGEGVWRDRYLVRGGTGYLTERVFSGKTDRLFERVFGEIGVGRTEGQIARCNGYLGREG